MALVVQVGSEAPAVAYSGTSTCALGVEQYKSVACLNGFVQYGGNASIPDTVFFIRSQTNYVADELASYVGSPCTDFAYQGWFSLPAFAPSGQPQPNFYYFWGYDSPTTGLNDYFYPEGGNTGTTWPMENYYDTSTGQTDIWLYNSYYIGSSVLLPSGGFCAQAAGLKEQGTLTAGSIDSNSANYSSLAWYDTAWGYHGAWNTSAYYVDQPCSPPTVYFDCLNGVFYSSTLWGEGLAT